MKFETYLPSVGLRPYIRYFAIAENDRETEYKVFPSPGIVVGFQYRGQLACLHGNTENILASAGITGISNGYRTFKNSAHIGTVLVYFTETGFTHFVSHPAHLLFDLSLSLDTIFDRNSIMEVADKLAHSLTDGERIRIVESFLLSQLMDVQPDRLIGEAVRRIHQSKGTIRIKELGQQLFISQSPLEKRFRKTVGTSPKKFASIVRFQEVLDKLGRSKSLSDIFYDGSFFDQAHFIKDFKRFTGDTPENFKNSLSSSPSGESDTIVRDP